MIKIIADENIPGVVDFFSVFGEVKTRPGREIRSSDVVDADALILRSVTHVNQDLLEGSRVKFVGTCTIGTDHLDLEYLNTKGIYTASAPGSNARSVVEYVLSVLACLQPDWQQKTIGIIGCGNVGGRLYQQLSALGVSCRCYDPFLTEDDISDLTDLTTVLQCDVVCLHTPLTRDGPYPTHAMLGSDELALLPNGATLISAGRGGVIDERALVNLLEQRQDIRLALDVWENEPDINPELLQRSDIATPHIAGYSLDGKYRGAKMIAQALQQFLSTSTRGVNTSHLMPAQTIDVPLDVLSTSNSESSVNKIILAAYSVEADNQRLKIAALQPEFLAQRFDQLRKHYPVRREFSTMSFSDALKKYLNNNQLLKEKLRQLDFTVD